MNAFSMLQQVVDLPCALSGLFMARPRHILRHGGRAPAWLSMA